MSSQELRQAGMFYRSVIAVALVFRAHTLIAQAASSPDSIRRLSPAAFPSLPVHVRHDLGRRGCSVPQPSGGPTPTNVLHGAYTVAGVSEWAVLCSVRDTSQILIYRVVAGGYAHVLDSLARSADVGWVQDVGDGRLGFSRLIRRLPLDAIRARRRDVDGRPIPQPIDHDAIEQVFVGKGAEAFYCAAGHVYRRVTAD